MRKASSKRISTQKSPTTVGNAAVNAYAESGGSSEAVSLKSVKQGDNLPNGLREMDKKEMNKKTTTKAATNSTSARTKAKAKTSISEDDIALRAWLIWNEEGCPEDRAIENWLKAETELRSS